MTQHLSGRTRLFPIIGDPIVYVQSPQRLSAGFARRGHDGLCVPMQVAEGDLDVVMRGLSRSGNVDGLLVTMPHKFACHAWCASASETSRRFGVVSVMRRRADGLWHGDMLDGRAFVKAQVDQGAQPRGARVLLLGAGGAGSAIALALLDAGVAQLVIHDSDPARSARLIEVLADVGAGRICAGPADPSGFDMVCNATPLGMADGDPLPVDAGLLRGTMFVGDVISGHGTTPLLQAAQDAGCRTANGDQMVDAVQAVMLDFLLGLDEAG